MSSCKIDAKRRLVSMTWTMYQLPAYMATYDNADCLAYVVTMHIDRHGPAETVLCHPSRLCPAEGVTVRTPEKNEGIISTGSIYLVR